MITIPCVVCPESDTEYKQTDITIDNISECVEERFPKSEWLGMDEVEQRREVLEITDKLELIYNIDGSCNFVKAICYMINEECNSTCCDKSIKSYDDGITKIVYRDNAYSDDIFDNIPQIVKELLKDCLKCGRYDSMFIY